MNILEKSSRGEETIVAIATPLGQGAISLIRLSGMGAFEVLAKTFFPLGKKGRALSDRTAVLGLLRDEKGQQVDEVLVTVFEGPRSYTGEDVAEISCHGGILVTQKVLEALLAAGARAANPGEFSQRAFLNGKMDLTQAEAVMDLISAQTDLALRAASEQLAGVLGERLMELRAELLSLVAQVEAYIDFPDEDIDPETGELMLQRVVKNHQVVQSLLSTADQGRILREGARVVIYGAPNVGKSSLLNWLLGFDRAIVSDVAGTTRDTLEEVINLRGIPLRLVDTAGVHRSQDAIEQQGIERTRLQVKNADLILRVVDGSEAKGAEGLVEQQEEGRHLLILNKSDLGQHSDWDDDDGIRISCTENQGIAALEDAIFDSLAAEGEGWGGSLVAINSRHKDCLKRASADLLAAENGLNPAGGGAMPEITAMELRSALDHVGQIVGQVDAEEVLGEIFSSFCIGK
ncbi:MAG: tRNA uridine-5-carboxymethylaminomethyl(34) synthesis GTPase MnmE [Verrucomicrobiales bacterium]|nr:tRNA uridine-5-carboxymethylaminomethyl(34) synthesis GTPase MnmE [Verrucomicrobiales bacterium]